MVLPPEGGDVVTLGASGPAVWELLGDWTTLERLTSVLAGTFESDPRVVEADVEHLLVELADRGLLEVAANSGESAPQ
jgi:hypothetical protein